MGKTESGAVWLDPQKTSPYEFFQYWRNVDDADVIKCLKLLTFLPLSQIEEMAKWEGSQLNAAKEVLAYEVTKIIHGEEEAAKARDAARALFGAKADAADMPSTTLTPADFTDGAILVPGPAAKSGARILQRGSPPAHRPGRRFHRRRKDYLGDGGGPGRAI